MKQGVSFAEMAKHNVEGPSKKEEVRALTEDLKKMKQGISFASIVYNDRIDYYCCMGSF